MKNFSRDEIVTILRRHKLWLDNCQGGERANLRYANLSSADLSVADLRVADLSGADLRYANLSGANLSYANLSGANLSVADLRYADLSSANLSSANLSSADLSDAKGVASREQCVAMLEEIRKHVIEHGDAFDMSRWHGKGWSPKETVEHACNTSHCLAGWAQALCPDRAVRELDPVTAGVRLIPLAAGRFWDSDEAVKEWLRKRKYATAD